MSVTAIIPARLGSTRFPGKVLACETGMPLIRHVWEAASRSRSASRVVVATDDESVRSACAAFAAPCVMTSREHPNGTSRLAEAARVLGLAGDEIVVNVQGDEPELDAALIDGAVEVLRQTGAEVGTVASPMGPGQNPSDPNIVKVVLRLDGTALYFSRSLVPFDRDGAASAVGTVEPLRHVGLYAYRAAFLQTYAMLSPTALEATEQLEQLRVLAHGYRIAVAVLASSHEGIDTPEQYARFVARWRGRGLGAKPAP
ncbi:MAG: 3-deoxy-manno-octulosonate cytidylyltransferase [Phycisphaerales bacterium]